MCPFDLREQTRCASRGKQGVDVWNKWREEHPGIHPNLSGSNLTDTDLCAADLSDANLGESFLDYANLSNANLKSANLSRADIHMASLMHANLSKALLIGANCSGADLSGADLQGANLFLANLFRVNLDETNLNGAYVVSTIFGDVDLRSVKGLDTLYHLGLSTIGVDTIIRSESRIPERFLQGVGVPDNLITYARFLSSAHTDHSSCFISYSSKDDAFAKRLYTDLQSHNVRCWFAPEDLKIDDKFWHRIDESIRLYDKLLVVLSEHSVQSDWVEREVMAALEKEKQGKMVLFPITLDDVVKDCTAPWAADLRRQRHIGDFRKWKNHDEYQKAFNRLLRDLKAAS